MAPDLIFCSSKRLTVDFEVVTSVDDLLKHTFTKLTHSRIVDNPITSITLDAIKCCFYVLCNGKKLSYNSIVEDEKTYHIVPRVLGGKGGFGSMLRAIGAQIEKTTSREACRDLSGRRMRDINNEKKLKEWLAKEAEREQEREARRQERLAKRLAPHRHKFDDKEYQQQKLKVQEDLEEALSTGLKRKQAESAGSSASTKKSKTAACSSSKAEWLGADLDSDDLESNSEAEGDPGSPGDSSVQNGSKVQTDGSSSMDSEENSSSSSNQITKTELAGNDSPPCSTSRCQTGTDSQETDSVIMVNSTSDHHHPKPSEGSVVNETFVQTSQSIIAASADMEPVDLESYASIEELSKLGLERLKNALMARGLKCGGSLQERAARLLSVKGLSPDQIDPNLFANSKGKGKGKHSQK